MSERISPGSEQLRSIDRPNTSRPGRLLRSMGRAAGRLLSPETSIPLIILGVGVVTGGSEILPNFQITADFLQMMEPDLSRSEAYIRVVLAGDENVTLARRFLLDLHGVGALKPLQESVSQGLPITQGVDPNIYAIHSDHVRPLFNSYAYAGLKNLVPGALAIAGVSTIKRIMDRKGPESLYEPGFAQAQVKYDLPDAENDPEEINKKIKDLLAKYPNKTDEMEQTYYHPDRCKAVIDELFKGHDRNQRKEARESIGLTETDEIDARQFRLVNTNGEYSIVLRIKRVGETIFGKKTYPANKGYPKILDVALSKLSANKNDIVVTTTKRRIVIEKEVDVVDPETGKKLGIKTKAFLNYDEYPDPTDPDKIKFTRVEIVVPAFAGVKPEKAFPDFTDALKDLDESTRDDQSIGIDIREGRI